MTIPQRSHVHSRRLSSNGFAISKQFQLTRRHFLFDGLFCREHIGDILIHGSRLANESIDVQKISVALIVYSFVLVRWPMRMRTTQLDVDRIFIVNNATNTGEGRVQQSLFLIEHTTRLFGLGRPIPR